MPRIDTYTAPSAPAVPHQPGVVTQTGEWQGAPALAQANKLTHQWAIIAGNLKANADHLDFLQAKADREAGLAQASLDLSQDQELLDNPLLYESKLRDAELDVSKRIHEGLKSKTASGMFEAYRQQELPGELVKGRAQGLRLLEGKNAARYVVEKDRLAKAAGEAATPEDFRMNMHLFEGLVVEMEGNRMLTQAEREKETISFNANVAENNMRFIGEQDPTRMRRLAAEGTWSTALPESKRIAVMEHVATREHVGEQRAREQFKQVRDVYTQGLGARANFQLLTQAEIIRGQQGLDPIEPDPEVWNRLAKQNEDAPGLTASDGVGMRAIDSVRLGYALVKEPTKQDAQQALDELDALRKEGGLSRRAMSHAIQASEHIQGRIVALDAAERAQEGAVRAAEAGKRAEKSFQDAQLAKKIQDAHNEFDSQYKRSPLSRIAGKVAENKRLMLRAQVERALRNNPGMDVKDAVTQVLGTPAEQSDAAQPDNIDLLRKR